MSEVERSCIKCGQPMRQHTLEEVEVDVCPGCGGIWLDRGEIQRITSVIEPGVEPQPDGDASPYRTSTPPAISSRSPLDTPCPGCGGKLALASFPSFNIEHCTTCEGIYLDPGELEKAIKAIDASGSKVATIVALARSVATRGTIGD